MRVPPCLALFALLLAPGLLHAHPVPKENHDRTVVVYLTPAGVVVDYRLEVDESRAVLDVRLAALEGVTSRKDFHAAYRKHFAPVIADNLVATLDGKELTFRCVEQRSELRDHVRCDYRFVADWKLARDVSHKFSFREGNFHFDGFSALSVRLSHSPKITLRDVAAPDDELINRPTDKRRPGDDERLRRLRAVVVDIPSYEGGTVRPPMPADLDDVRPAPQGELSRYGSAIKPVPREPMGRVRDNPPPGEDEGGPAHAEHRSELLDLLLDTRSGLAVLLLLAALFGAAHALTPGHGKTLVAAYLVGQHGTYLHALVLGLVTTLTHTGSVILLAVVLAMTGLGSASAVVVLNLVGGLMIAGLGVWLLMKRLTGRADHVHIGGGHETPDLSRPGASWWATVLMGMGGGIVPCWDAIILLMFAVSVQRLWLGVVLLLAFSAGLAAVLVALGLVVVVARAGALAVAGEGRLERAARFLPILSAVAIIVIGLIMAFGSVRG